MEKVMKVRKVRVQEDDAWRKPRVYFSIKSESLFENLENRWSRPYKGYRQQDVLVVALLLSYLI
jgi:hypothetical protein